MASESDNSWNSTLDYEWNPLYIKSSTMPPLALVRIKRELENFKKENMENIFVEPQINDISIVHALIIGPEGTPYDGGFFYFYLKFTSDYPMKPPKVMIKTTDSGRVRFNPNLYSNGKVCLSILGTWPGPSWSPVLSLTTVLLSIQSLMNEEPYHNEPAYEKSMCVKVDDSAVKNYNEIVQHETFRVAVIQMLENSADAKNMPQPLKDIMRKKFIENYQKYEKSFMKKQSQTGSIFDSLYGQTLISNYSTLLEKLKQLKKNLKIPN